MACCRGSFIASYPHCPFSTTAAAAPATHLMASLRHRPSYFSLHSSLRFSALRALESNSSSSTADLTASDGPEPIVEPPTDAQNDGNLGTEQEQLGQALSQIRKERVAAGKEDPSKTEDFWRGVLEETRLIEWPSIQKVLGTTGVVMSIIVGSSLVLLTVNAVLARLSDTIFNNAPPV